jgi:endonuclease/exonuclease/phosphatase family metal-dependent hydrolase
MASAPGSADIAGDVASAPASSGTIRIATFNIQVFGVTKRENPEIMSVLTEVARKFDILAIQEVRDSSETTVDYFLSEINESGSPTYKAVIGPRLGRSSSKEQYAFIYNSERVNYIANSMYTFNDSQDVFEREPLVARFKAGNFSFVLVDIHTKPDDATAEIDALDDVISDALHYYSGEKDVIALGDFNGDCSYFKPEDHESSLQAPKYLWIVPDNADTTTRESTNCAYDRMVALEASTSEDYSGHWGIERFDTEFGLDEEETVDVSDHFPVWADFKTSEDTDGGPSS